MSGTVAAGKDSVTGTGGMRRAIDCESIVISASGIFCWDKSVITCLAATCISSILSESFMVVMPMTQSTVNIAAAAIFNRSKCFIICLFFSL